MTQDADGARAPIRAPAVRCGWITTAACIVAGLLSVNARAQLTGETGAHDPSTLTHLGSKYFYFATGQGIVSRSSTNLTQWSAGPAVFATAPSWTTTAVPGFDGFFWAPDVTLRNNQYYLYYSVSTWGSKTSAIGLATSPTLDSTAANYAWTDRGAVIQSNNSTPYNAIDASVFNDTDGRAWMSFGSYSNGIYLTELNPTTGLRLSPATAPLRVAASSNANNGSTIEGSAITKRNGYYYLFVNYGGCCSGVDSTYNIRVGRSTSVTGPFLDRNGVNMNAAGGTMFLDDDGNKIGPGHFSLFSEGGTDKFGYHYYDGNRNGAPTYGLHNLYWTADEWPTYAAVNPNWTGTTNSNWSTPTNWSDTVPNAAGAIANFRSISSGRFAIAVDTAPRTLATMNFDSAATYTVGSTSGNGITLDKTDGTSVTLNVASGSHLIGAPLTTNDELGVNVTPDGSTLTLLGSVTGAALQKYGSGALALNSAVDFSGTALIHDGTLVVNGITTVSQYMSIGAVVGDVATMRVRGTGSILVNGDLNVGDTGDGATEATGTLELQDTASITVGTAGGFYVGSGFFINTRAVGTVNQTGGTLAVNGTFDGAFIIGGRTSSRPIGVYNLSAGSVNANTNVRVGGRGSGTVNQTGGNFNAAGYVSIGRYGGSIGTWNITDGVLNHTNASTQIIVGEAGAGTLTIGGGGAVNTASALRLGQSGGTGTLNLNGGTLTASAIQRGTGSGFLNFDGGTVRAAVATTSFLQGLNTALIRTGGATFDSNSFDISVAQALTHDFTLAGVDGGLRKVGGGRLTLSGVNSYTGVTILNEGSLRFGSSTQNVLTNSGGLEINAGHVLFDYIAGNSPAETIRQELAESFASGFLAGQIRSATIGPGDALGWKTLGTTQVQIALTSLGDANLDLAVNFDDLLTLAQNYGAASGAIWTQGDFNYDTRVDFDDLLVLAQQYGLSAVTEVTVESGFGDQFVADWRLAYSLVPEPVGAYLVVVVAQAVGLQRSRSTRRGGASKA